MSTTVSTPESGRESGTKSGPAPAPAWRDPKRYLWLLAVAVPSYVLTSWLAVWLTGWGIFWWSAPIAAFIVLPLADWVFGLDDRSPPADALGWLENDRFYRWVTYLYLPAQYASLVLACRLWSDGHRVPMNVFDKLGLMFTVGIIGGIAICTAHELGHQRVSRERWLSKAALAQTGYGHFYVEHNRGHHHRVATPEDPASSRLGESLYRFLPRSILGGARSAWILESSRRRRRGKAVWSLSNDVLNAWLMSAALFAALTLWFGLDVLPWLVGQAVVGICLMEAVNYLEHYGLRRQRLADGRYERVHAGHSWNSNSLLSNVFLFHLQRHSDHHANPLRRYQALRHADEAPQLPSGYATMIVAALVPPLWRRIMDRRVLEHYGGDITLAAHPPRSRRRRSRTAADRCP